MRESPLAEPAPLSVLLVGEHVRDPLTRANSVCSLSSTFSQPTLPAITGIYFDSVTCNARVTVPLCYVLLVASVVAPAFASPPGYVLFPSWSRHIS
jgi:hypothetical protein